MLRRALVAAVLAALTVCGAASAMLLGPTADPPTTTSATTLTATTATVSSTVATGTGASTTTTAPAPTPATPVIGKPSVTLLLAGHGWGHGAGMSQWGAKGYAEHGWTYDRILAHYYTATQLGQAGATTVRVLLVEGAKSLTLASTGPWSVVDGDGEPHELAPGKLALPLALKVQGVVLPPPLTFQPGGTPLQLAGKAYRGTIGVDKGAGGKLVAVDTVGLEDYLRGVVASEMPSAWPAEALK